MSSRRRDRAKVDRRFTGLRLAVVIVGVLLAVRAFQIQVVQHEFYAERAERLWGKVVATNAERGNFYDRHGRPLALSATTYKVGVSHRWLDDADGLSEVFADVLGMPVAEVRRKIRQGGPNYACIAPDVVLTPRQRRTLRREGGSAVTLDPLYARVYPYDGVGASYLGFYRPDAVQDITTGLECSLDDLLAGHPGRSRLLLGPLAGTDRGDVVLEEARHGLSLTLTLDADLQAICEQRLAAAVADYRAIGGSVLVMDPHTGDVLAAASWPLMETRDRSHPDTRVWQNRNFTRIFEPGSVLKVFTTAALLKHAAVDTSTRFNCDNDAGPGIYVKNDGGHDYGLMTLMQAFAQSANVYFAKAVANLTAAEFYRTLVDFGFGAETGAAYPGEPDGLLADPGRWSGRSKQTIAIGQEISVTAVQLGAALCSVGNGGTLYAPRIVRDVRDDRGRLLEEVAPTALRQVMSPQLAALLREAMSRVVREGTGVGTQMDWITLGGKTGTAQKVREGDDGYTPGAYVASFGGLVPIDEPRLMVLAVLDEPRGTYHYAAQSAVPLFRDIVADIRRSSDWLTDVRGARTASFAAPDAGRLIEVPDVMYLSADSAVRRLAARELGSAGAEKGGLVVAQVPAAGTRCAAGTVVELVVADADRAAAARPGVCPDFSGKSNREVLGLAAQLNIRVDIRGAGYAVEQSVRPGETVAGDVVTVRMKGSRL